MKRRDINELARSIVDEATGEEAPDAPEKTDKDDNSPTESGRRGGLKGGKARAEKLTPEQRREIAVRAARKRWQKSSSE
jgi:hypothetical protein